MRPGGVWPALALLLVALAGCTGGQDADPATVPSAGPAGFDEGMGAIEGSVVNEEGLPVPMAQVGLIPSGLESLADGEGRFVFSNVEPGRYTVVAQKIGFTSTARSVTVAADDVVTVQLELNTIEIMEGYHDSWPETGYFDCSWGFLGSTGPCFYGVYQLEWPNSKRAFVYQAEPGLVSAFNELTWDKVSYGTSDALQVTFSYQNRTGGHWYCNAAGPKPAVMHWERSFDDGQPEWEDAGECLSGGSQLPNGQPETVPKEGQELRSFVNSGRSDVNGNFGIAIQQSFDMWISLFYWEPAPEGFTALQDG